MDAVEFHKRYKGKIGIKVKMPVKSREDLSIAYTPGVAEVVKAIDKNEKLSFETTLRGNSIAILSNSTRVLGLGKVKAEAGLAVMEGKALLFKEFGDVDAFPLSIRAEKEEELIFFAKAIESSFGGINLEDIESPLVFSVYEKLSKELKIPVFHDDRHGTGIVCLAGVINALKIINIENPKIVVVGLGSAGVGIIEMLRNYGFKEIYSIDSKGAVCDYREGVKGTYKEEMSRLTSNKCISREEIFKDANIVIAASSPGSINEEDLKLISKDSAVFSLSNPVPEIPYEISKKYAKIVGTGRSDLPNQINNLLAFPGIFRGALNARAEKITKKAMLEASIAIAEFVNEVGEDRIVPSPLNKKVHDYVAKKVEGVLS